MAVTLVDSMGDDLSVVNAARVSFDKVSDYVPHDGFDFESGAVLKKEDIKLISYLAKHNHFSPFCHAFASFRIKAPIFVARQLAKHQVGLSWNEVSRRYVDSEPEFFFPDAWRGKAANVKQGSTDGEFSHPQFVGSAVLNTNLQEELLEPILEAYNSLIEAGICAEQARMVLPLNTMTEWVWSGSLFAFARVCNLRLDPHAQKECRDVAKMISDDMREYFRESWQVLLKTQEMTEQSAINDNSYVVKKLALVQGSTTH
jgi:thymidylate synthase (FAD)